MSSRLHHLNGSAGKASTIFEAALSKIRLGDHDAVSNLIEAVRSSGHNDEVTTGVLEAAQRLAQTWGKLREETAQRERILAQSKEHATALADELVRILTIVQSNMARATGPIESVALERVEEVPAVQGAVVHLRDCTRTVASASVEPAPALRVNVLAPFRVFVNDHVIDDWPNGKTKAIFKYLLLNRQRPIAKEALMELFWPDLDPEAARNNLNVAIHRLRRTLARGATDPTFVLFADGHYVLNPRVSVSTDAEDFMAYLRRGHAAESAGRPDEAAEELTRCVDIYQIELLAEDRYEAWIEPLRQQLRDACLDALDRLCRYHLARERYAACIAMCGKILSVDACNEEAHRTLMRCYARMSQPHLATQQYQTCVRTLSRELGISPSTETAGLYREIAHRELM